MFKFWKFGNNATATERSEPSRSSMPEGFTAEKEARRMILADTAKEGLRTSRLIFEWQDNLVTLPKGLVVRELEINDCPSLGGLPSKLWAQDVRIRRCPGFSRIPGSAAITSLEVEESSTRLTFGRGVSIGTLRLTNYAGHLEIGDTLICGALSWVNSPLTAFPSAIRVSGTLDLTGSRDLVNLPARLAAEQLILRGCSNLEKLPDRFTGDLLDISGCGRLRWQDDGLIEVRRLDISGCSQITSLPYWLFVEESIDIANSGLKDVPRDRQGCRWRWRGVEVNERIAFRPEEITVHEIFAQRNSEVRRVMLERIGWERFFAEAKPKLLSRDRDSGGERRLLRVALPDREELVALCVGCPSTGRRYFIRVPPQMKSCHQAAAWIAGFDDPKEYEPVMET